MTNLIKMVISALLLVGLFSCSSKKIESNQSSASSPQWHKQIEITNPSDHERAQESFYFTYSYLGLDTAHANMTDLRARWHEAGEAVQHIDMDGDGKKDGILVLLDLGAKENSILSLLLDKSLPLTRVKKMTQAEISCKEGGKWIDHPSVEGKQAYVGGEFKNVNELTAPPQYTDHSNWIRYEGPGIESDKVGYRIYLDWRNGFDIFGKSTSEPVLQKVGLDGYDSYHEWCDWGMDILKVGSTLGTGGFAYWNGHALTHLAEVEQRRVKIIENGDLFSSFSISYGQWSVADKKLDVDAIFSMQAGSRLVHTRVALSDTLSNLAVGIVKHEGTRFLDGNIDIPGNAYTYIASWGQQSLHGDNLGMAVLLKRKILQKIVDDGTSYVAVVDPDRAGLDYYFLAAWAGEHGRGIDSQEAFEAYLKTETEKLSLPARIELKTPVTGTQN